MPFKCFGGVHEFESCVLRTTVTVIKTCVLDTKIDANETMKPIIVKKNVH